VAFGVYLLGGTDQCPRVFAHVLRLIYSASYRGTGSFPVCCARPLARCRLIPSSVSPNVLPVGSLPGSWASHVNSPIAKYASCSRAQAPQKGTPRISTTARLGHGFFVSLLTWQDSGFVLTWFKSIFLPRSLEHGTPG
jgi:hypothetical protein